MTTPWEPPEIPYLQAAERIRRKIATGEWSPGQQIPSSRQLQHQFNLASSTVQNTLRLLKRQGLIYTVQGRGAFVCDGAAEIAASHGPAHDLAADELRDRIAALESRLASVESRLERLEDA